MPKAICPAEDGWSAAYEGDSVTKPCGSGFSGTITRFCLLGAEWGDPISNCSRRGGGA